MSNTKTVMGQASNQYVAPLDITDVFSTYLYTGTGAAQTITNGIDLAGEGGLVWIKSRSGVVDHNLMDTERGLVSEGGGPLTTTTTSAQGNNAQTITSFNSNGFTAGTEGSVSTNAMDFASWTFRKAPKFFDVVTWTGTGVAGRTVSHSLGSVPGMIIVKRTNTTGSWVVYHRGLNNGNSPEDYGIILNTTAGQTDQSLYWNDTAPTDTNFTLGSANSVNGSGSTYVAYVFAHNNGDGEFGPGGDQDIIKCGNYEGNGSDSRTIDLGFEAQWVFLKRSDGATDWFMLDNMRGLPVRSVSSQYLEANTANAEAVFGSIFGDNQGFMVDAGDYNTSGEDYIYMAIRRGPLTPPTAGTEVYSAGVVQNNTGRTLTNPLGHPSDWAFTRGSGEANWIVQSRLTGKADLKFDLTNSEVSNKGYGFANNTNYEADGTAAIGAYGWNFRRAPSFLDIVCYTGAGANTVVNHNLGVVPEMIWVKNRSRASTNWNVYHKDLELNSVANTAMDVKLFINLSFGVSGVVDTWGSSGPSATNFTLGTNQLQNSYSGDTYIAYLFASLSGISKVGSVSHTVNSATDVDCGFTSGARFILLKVTDSSGSWHVYDTTRGIVAGNDARLKLDSNAAQNTNNDDIDPLSSGFTIAPNVSTGTYIFYAIA
jgi:hypothetical protein